MRKAVFLVVILCLLLLVSCDDGFSVITITNSSKKPVYWRIMEPDGFVPDKYQQLAPCAETELIMKANRGFTISYAAFSDGTMSIVGNELIINEKTNQIKDIKMKSREGKIKIKFTDGSSDVECAVMVIPSLN